MTQPYGGQSLVIPASGSSIDQRMAAMGLVSATLEDYALASVAFSLTAGVFGAALAPFQAGQRITSLGCCLNGAGVTSSGVTSMGLYTSAGVQIDNTGDMTAQFSSAPPLYITGNLSGGVYTVPASGMLYIGFVTHFSGTAPTILGSPAATGGAVSFMPVNGHYMSVFTTAQATLPASFTPSGLTLNSGMYYLTAQ